MSSTILCTRFCVPRPGTCVDSTGWNRPRWAAVADGHARAAAQAAGCTRPGLGPSADCPRPSPWTARPLDESSSGYPLVPIVGRSGTPAALAGESPPDGRDLTQLTVQIPVGGALLRREPGGAFVDPLRAVPPDPIKVQVINAGLRTAARADDVLSAVRSCPALIVFIDTAHSAETLDQLPSLTA
jgi:hypothetical protein